ncbi:FAD-dependent oxidoreductase [Negadavirga shengliensis]|uniref:FAD-dependent oxidoreductase n=1 Tax=Negadavirga shengliensis TaxID=1389218 RepID=A0ABV9SX62_9BACT
MDRRNFIGRLTAGGLAASALPHLAFPAPVSYVSRAGAKEMKADVVIAGGGLGGFAAGMAALRNGLKVIMTEETDWIGGQITQQGVPSDEHQWIETTGATQMYRDYRNGVRDYYRKYYPMREEARKNPLLNPGNSTGARRLGHEPKVTLAVMYQMLAPYLSNGQLTLLLEHKVIDADNDGEMVRSLLAKSRIRGSETVLEAPYFIDATELGDLLPLTNTAYVTGTESNKQTGEMHAPDQADPDNDQAFTLCFAVDYLEGEDHTIDKPDEYEFWRNFEPKMKPPWSGKLLDWHYSNPSTLEPRLLGFDPRGGNTGDLLNLWNYRRLVHKDNFEPGFFKGDITVVNWPQNDYFLGSLIDVPEETFKKHVARATQLNLSLLYWLQTEAPRMDGGRGWPGLRLRKDVMGTEDGMAKYPYVRESRRIKALFTILEEHVGRENRASVTGNPNVEKAENFYDSVGIGYYHIDLHPSTGGDNYIDFRSFPFQIPLGALIPETKENLFPANKNIGTTHITNGCYRLAPVEWSIGEAVGLLLAFSSKRRVRPREIREGKLLAAFQQFVRSQGIHTHWPDQV